MGQGARLVHLQQHAMVPSLLLVTGPIIDARSDAHD